MRQKNRPELICKTFYMLQYKTQLNRPRLTSGFGEFWQSLCPYKTFFLYFYYTLPF